MKGIFKRLHSNGEKKIVNSEHLLTLQNVFVFSKMCSTDGPVQLQSQGWWHTNYSFLGKIILILKPKGFRFRCKKKSFFFNSIVFTQGL